MRYLAIVTMALLLAAAILLIIRFRREQQKELYRMEALRDTKLYKDLQPLLQRAASRDLDQVRVERGRVIITQVYPAGTLGVFELCQSGHYQMSRTRTRVLSEVIAEDLDILQDGGKYSFARRRVIRANGSVDHSYTFTIRTAYKDSVIRAHERFRATI
ncbi:MAG: hypothetical protein IJS53_02435 [Clostridia bacterium]|nr:hypothetical protein [Clostridia bacterium]